MSQEGTAVVWGCCARSRQAGLRSQVAPLPTNSPPPAGSSKPLPQEGFTCKIKNQAAVATLLRDRIAIRSFATVWAQSLGQMTHGIDGCFSAPQNQGDGSPSFTCLHSASGSPLGATVRPGVVQLLVAIDQRSAASDKGPSWSLPKASAGCSRCWNRGLRPYFRALTRQPLGSCVVHACMLENRPPQTAHDSWSRPPQSS